MDKAWKAMKTKLMGSNADAHDAFLQFTRVVAFQLIHPIAQLSRSRGSKTRRATDQHA